MVHACHPSIKGAEAGGSPEVQSQPELQDEFKANLNYIAIICLKIIKVIIVVIIKVILCL